MHCTSRQDSSLTRQLAYDIHTAIATSQLSTVAFLYSFFHSSSRSHFPGSPLRAECEGGALPCTIPGISRCGPKFAPAEMNSLLRCDIIHAVSRRWRPGKLLISLQFSSKNEKDSGLSPRAPGLRLRADLIEKHLQPQNHQHYSIEKSSFLSGRPYLLDAHSRRVHGCPRVIAAEVTLADTAADGEEHDVLRQSTDDLSPK